jgi:chemotaxis protein MotA
MAGRLPIRQWGAVSDAGDRSRSVSKFQLEASGAGEPLAMFIVIGAIVVFGCIVGGFLMEHGNILVLLQPAELIIIGGAAVGTLLIANPLHVIKKIAAGVARSLKGSQFTKAFYLETLKMSYEILNKARKDGLLAIESDIEEPEKSAIFSKYPKFLKDHHMRDFVCDTLRMAVTGGIDPFDLDQMMDLDMEVSHREANAPIAALSTMADALPGLGIVAAVLGVVVTMGALGGPPEEIGHKVAAALVGTFLGILLCYGLVGPISQNMAKAAEEEHAYVYVVRVLMIAFIKGAAPIQALEFGRRAIPMHLRPGFNEMEKSCKGSGAAAVA